MSNFDKYEERLMDTVLWQYGDTATWTPKAGGEAQTQLVLFNDPDTEKEIQDTKYSTAQPTMEYRLGHFPGLYESSKKNVREIVSVKSVEYYVMSVKKKVDGDVYIASLEPK